MTVRSDRDYYTLTWSELEPMLFELEAAVKAENSDAIRALLQRIVPEFNPQSENGDVLKEVTKGTIH